VKGCEKAKKKEKKRSGRDSSSDHELLCSGYWTHLAVSNHLTACPYVSLPVLNPNTKVTGRPNKLRINHKSMK